MKYLAFAGLSLMLVPLTAVLAARSRTWQGRLLATLLFSVALGDIANINFVSMESYRGPERGFEISLTDLLALGLSLGLLLGRGSGRVPMNSLWMSLFFCWSVLSFMAAPAPLFSSFFLFKLVRVFIVYWCVARVLERGVDWRYVQLGLTAVGLFALVLSLKQKYVDGIYRVPLLFDHSNTVPPLLNLVVPVLLLLALRPVAGRAWESRIGIVAALGMVFAVVMTYSRAGGALAAAALCGALCIANVRLSSRRVRLSSAAVALLLLFGSIGAMDSIVERFRTAPESSEEARDEFNVAAEMMAADHLLGVGPNNFSRVLTDEERYNSHIEVMSAEGEAGVAHHIYWLTAAEVGYLGLALFLVIIARFWWSAWRWGWGRSSSEGLVLTGVAIGMTALHLSGFFEWALRITPVSQQFAIACGFVAGGVARLRFTARQRRPYPQHRPVVFAPPARSLA